MTRTAAALLLATLLLACNAEKKPPASGVSPDGTPPASKGSAPEGFKPAIGDADIKNSEVAYNLALEQAGKGDWEAANHYIDLAMTMVPDAKYSFTKGLFCLQQGKYPLAKQWLERSLAQGPGTTDNRMAVYNALGAAYMQLGEDDKALEQFRQVVTTAGMVSRYESYYNMGVIYLRQEKWLDAEAVLTKVVDENPGYFRAWHKLGLIEAHKGDWEGAATLHKRAIDLIRNNYAALQGEGAEIYCGYGEALYQLKRFDESRQAFMDALKISPESAAGQRAKERLGILGTP